MSRKPISEKDQKKQQEIFASIGEAISAWNAVEDALAYVFGEALSITQNYSMSAYHAVISLEARLAMVDAVVSMRLRDEPDLLAKWSSLTNRVSKKAKKRAELAHCSVFTFTAKNGSTTTEAFPFFGVTKLSTGTVTRGRDKMPVHKGGIALNASDIRARIVSFHDLQRQLSEISHAISDVTMRHEEARRQKRGLQTKHR